MRNLKNYDEFMAFCADALDPIVSICADSNVAQAFRAKNTLGAVKEICKNHAEEVAVVLAALDGVTVERFKAEFSPLSIPKRLTDLLNADEVKELFAYAQQTVGASSSGNAQEIIPD